MQKAVFVFVLFAIVAATLANHEHGHQHPGTPKPLAQTFEDQELLDTGIANHRVTRQLPAKMPSMDEMKNFVQEQIKKLPPQAQEAIHRAQEMAQKMIPGH